MKSFHRAAIGVLALVALVGCASTSVSDRERYEGPMVPRPGRIIVYDFAASAIDLPAWSNAGQRYDDAETPPSPQELETGRKLGAQVASELVKEIQAMGLPAVREEGQRPPETNDLVLIGYFLSVHKGSTLERVTIGFGAGAADLKTYVEGYRMTDLGLRKAGAGEVDAGDSKGPGMVVPAVVTVATANPIGLAVGGAVKAEGELSGRDTIEGSAKRTAQAIAKVLRQAFERQGWI